MNNPTTYPTALRKIKHTSMTAAKGQEHRMTMFGALVKYRGQELQSAICKDCGEVIQVHMDGTVTGEAATKPCRGVTSHGLH